VLAFVDVIVIPFLTSLYGAVGYLGVFFAMVIRIDAAAAAVGADPAIRRLPDQRPQSDRAAYHSPGTSGSSWSSASSPIRPARCAGMRWARSSAGPSSIDGGGSLLIRKHEVDQAEHFFGRWARRPPSSAACCLAFEASSASSPASRTCRSAASSSIRPWVPYPGRSRWSTPARSSARTGSRSATRCDRSTPLILVACVLAVVLFRVVAPRPSRLAPRQARGLASRPRGAAGRLPG